MLSYSNSRNWPYICRETQIVQSSTYLWLFIFMPPLKKRWRFFCTCRSVIRNVDPVKYVCSIPFGFFALKLLNLVQWMSLESRCFSLIFRSHGQRSSSHCWSLYKCCLLNIFWPLCFEIVKLGTYPRKEMFLLMVNGQSPISGLWKNSGPLNIWNFYC